MSFLAWIVLGLISGFIASKIVNKRGEGFFSTSSWALLARLPEAGFLAYLAQTA